jgi:hypothetical protein
MIRWLIFLNRGQFYIFHKFDYACIFFRLCTCFSNNLVEFHSRKKKCFKLQGDEFKLNFWRLHDEAFVEMIRMDIWNALFGAQTRKLWHFENASRCKTGGSDLRNWRIQFSQIRPEFESIFLMYLVSFLSNMEGLCLATYIYVGHDWL